MTYATAKWPLPMKRPKLEVSIDLCQPAELAFVEDSYIHTTKQHYRGRGLPDEGLNVWLRHRFKVLCETGTLLVASDDGVALGWILAERRGERLCVTGLYVKHLYRRLDVGKQLLAAAQGLLDGHGMCYDTVSFRAGRAWAQRIGAERL